MYLHLFVALYSVQCITLLSFLYHTAIIMAVLVQTVQWIKLFIESLAYALYWAEDWYITINQTDIVSDFMELTAELGRQTLTEEIEH